MKNLQSLLPALIIALAVLAGLLGGAKIISNGVIQANRFQDDVNGGFFDSATGGLYRISHSGWSPTLKSYRELPFNINEPWEWVEYLEETKTLIKDARKEYHD